MAPMRCVTVKINGDPCKNSAILGKAFCRWHSPSPADIAKHLEESRRGGHQKAWGAMPEGVPLAEESEISGLDLSTAQGVRDYMSAALYALARLPFSVKVASAVAQLASAQRACIETGDIETRLDALESAEPIGPRRVA